MVECFTLYFYHPHGKNKTRHLKRIHFVHINPTSHEGTRMSLQQFLESSTQMLSINVYTSI